MTLLPRAGARDACALACVLGSSIALGGCAVATPESAARASAEPAPEVEIEEPLEVSVDRVDRSHGGVRVTASMEDGSADVSMWLGRACEAREVGSGFATPSHFVWTLSVRDVARAASCGLVVRARGPLTPRGRVVKVGNVGLSLQVSPFDADTVLQSQASNASSSTTMLEFTQVRRGATLLVGDDVLVGSIDGGDDDQESGNGGNGGNGGNSGTRESDGPVDRAKRTSSNVRTTFEVPNVDLATALVTARPLAIAGDEAVVTVSVGGTQISSDDDEEVEEEVQVEDCE